MWSLSGILGCVLTSYSLAGVTGVRAINCDCSVIGNLDNRDADKSQLAHRNTFIFTTMDDARATTQTLFAAPVNSTFSCACQVKARQKAVGYIVSAVKTNALGLTALACMQPGVVEEMCRVLGEMRIASCMSMWRTGFAANTDPPSAATEAMLETVRRVFLHKAPAKGCFETIDFIKARDASITTGITTGI